MHCPFRNFKKCPEHNKKNGCSFWLSYTSNSESVEAQVEGCAITLTPMLLLENANNLGIVAGEMNKVGAEVSALRDENIKENEANRIQFVNLAHGNKELVRVDYTQTVTGING